MNNSFPFVRLMPGRRAGASYFIRYDGGADAHEVAANGERWECFIVELTAAGFERVGLCPGYQYRGKCRHVLFIERFHLRARPYVEASASCLSAPVAAPAGAGF